MSFRAVNFQVSPNPKQSKQNFKKISLKIIINCESSRHCFANLCLSESSTLKMMLMIYDTSEFKLDDSTSLSIET